MSGFKRTGYVPDVDIILKSDTNGSQTTYSFVVETQITLTEQQWKDLSTDWAQRTTDLETARQKTYERLYGTFKKTMNLNGGGHGMIQVAFARGTVTKGVADKTVADAAKAEAVKRGIVEV